jgi:hypothetical protein
MIQVAAACCTPVARSTVQGIERRFPAEWIVVRQCRDRVGSGVELGALRRQAQQTLPGRWRRRRSGPGWLFEVESRRHIETTPPRVNGR